MQKMILLIDDDREELLILDQAFKMAGLPYSCVWASGLERAFQLLTEVLPDYILIDYNMPKINGIECLEQVRSLPGIAQVPIVMYSSYLSEETRRQAMNRGANGFIQKTPSLVQLINALKKALGEGKWLPSVR